MREKYFSFFLIIFLFISNTVFSAVEERIIAKIGNDIITRYDVINEINTILALSNTPANKDNIDNLKDIAFVKLKKNW